MLSDAGGKSPWQTPQHHTTRLDSDISTAAGKEFAHQHTAYAFGDDVFGDKQRLRWISNEIRPIQIALSCYCEAAGTSFAGIMMQTQHDIHSVDEESLDAVRNSYSMLHACLWASAS